MTLMGFYAARTAALETAAFAAVGGTASSVDLAAFNGHVVSGHLEPHELLALGAAATVPTPLELEGLEPEEEGAEGKAVHERIFMEVLLSVPAAGLGVYARHLPLVQGTVKEKTTISFVGHEEALLPRGGEEVLHPGEWPIPRAGILSTSSPTLSTPEVQPFEAEGSTYFTAELDPAAEWSNLVSYVKGDIVHFGGQNWEARGASKGVEPRVGATWEPIGETLIRLDCIREPPHNPTTLQLFFAWNIPSAETPGFFSGRLTPQPGRSLHLTGGLPYFLGFIPRGGGLVLPLTTGAGAVVRHKAAGVFADDPAVNGTAEGRLGEECGFGFGLAPPIKLDCLI